MTRSRTLDEIASNLDDMSVTLEEIKDGVQEKASVDREKLEQIQRDMERAADVIEENAQNDPPE